MPAKLASMRTRCSSPSLNGVALTDPTARTPCTRDDDASGAIMMAVRGGCEAGRPMRACPPPASRITRPPRAASRNAAGTSADRRCSVDSRSQPLVRIRAGRSDDSSKMAAIATAAPVSSRIARQAMSRSATGSLSAMKRCPRSASTARGEAIGAHYRQATRDCNDACRQSAQCLLDRVVGLGSLRESAVFWQSTNPRYSVAPHWSRRDQTCWNQDFPVENSRIRGRA